MNVRRMSEAAFVERRKAEWEALEAILVANDVRALRRLPAEERVRLAPLYRDICADLARAQAANYAASLIEYLQGLSSTTHSLLYGKSTSTLEGLTFAGARERLRDAFPCAVRRRLGPVTAASLLFCLPLIVGLLISMREPTFAYQIVPERMLRSLTESYAEGFSQGRTFGVSSAMTGFYVNNNVQIALRCFALGIFLGIGSVFFLVYNGLVIGAVLGYVTSQGAGQNIATFVVGHGSLELGAIMLAGGAGLTMGWAILSPGERTRTASLQSVAGDAVVIMAGACCMLLMAALIEGFWSGSAVDSAVKRSVGLALFVLVMTYLVFGGRTRKTGLRVPTARNAGEGWRP